MPEYKTPPCSCVLCRPKLELRYEGLSEDDLASIW